MDKLWSVDWAGLFVPSVSVAEMILRGTLVYLALFLILRFLLKRQSGVLGIADLLVVVLIADAAQNAMGESYKSVTEGLVLVLTIVFWNYAIDYAGYRYPALRRLTRPQALLIVENGRMHEKAMASEMITPEELMSQLRQQGVCDLGDVRLSYLEGDGRVSVIRREKDAEPEGRHDDRRLQG